MKMQEGNLRVSKKNTEDSRSITGSSIGASKVGRTSVAQMKKLKKSQDPTFILIKMSMMTG